MRYLGTRCEMVNVETNHMFSTGHEPFVNDLGSIVATGVNVNTLLYHRI